MTTPTPEDDVKQNDIACLRVNYDVEAWREITKGFTVHNVVAGSILAIDSLCTEVEQQRARIARLLGHIEAQAVRLKAAERDAERYQVLRRGQHWSVIDGIGDILRGDVLDSAIDTHRAAIASEAKP